MAPVIATIDALADHLRAYPEHGLNAQRITEQAGDGGGWPEASHQDQAESGDQERADRPTPVRKRARPGAAENQEGQQRHRSAIRDTAGTVSKSFVGERRGDGDGSAYGYQRRHVVGRSGRVHAEPPARASNLEDDWPKQEARFEAWLADSNFDASGTARRSLQ